MTAQEIELLTANNLDSGHEDNDALKVGVFARVTSPFIDLINNVDAARESDGRLQAMQGMAAAASAYQAVSAIRGNGALFGAEAGIGFSTNEDQRDYAVKSAQGSTISGGGNVSLTSTTGDIHVVQGNLRAGDTLTLDSADAILLESGQSTVNQAGSSSNLGAEVGVGVSVGAQTGVYVYAQASAGSSSDHTDITAKENTHLTADTINLRSQGDTTLRGADARANTINADVGGALTIESVQDTVEQASKSSQVGGRVQVSIGSAWSASGYASSAQADGSYQGVNQQSGLFAGGGGYHVNAGTVDLKGGAITSTNAGKSELTANSLTFSDLRNSIAYQASSASVSGGFGSSGNGSGTGNESVGTQLGDIGNTVSAGSYGAANNASFSPGVPMTESGKDGSTTYATLTEGNITIGGSKTSAADLGIHTDASIAHSAIKPLPDLQKVLYDQQAMSAAVGTVVETGLSIRNEIDASIDEVKRQKEEARARLHDPTQNLSPEDVKALVAFTTDADREIERLQKVGVLVGAITGGLSASSGSTSGILAYTLAPVVSYQIGQHFKENAARNVVDNGDRGEEGSASHLLAHALLGAAVAASGGDEGLIGAIAAAGAEAAAPALAHYLYGKDAKDLNAEEKSTVSAIVGLGGAIIGSFGSDLTAIMAGSSAARNAVDNNWGEVGHYSTMATVLYLAGLPEQDAKAIALAAWSPDTDRRSAITTENIPGGVISNGDQQSIHLLDGDIDPRDVAATQKELSAATSDIIARIKANENNPAAKAAILSDPETQRVLHAFGDSYAHVTFIGTHYPPVVGHGLVGTTPDDPNTHADAYREYSMAIYDAARTALSGVNARVDQSRISSLTGKVSNESGEQGQKDVLAGEVGGRLALVNSPVAGCEVSESCLGRNAANTVNPVIRQIYGIEPPATSLPPQTVDWSKLLNNIPR